MRTFYSDALIGILMAFLITVPIGLIVQGYVLTYLWVWFVVPVFHVAPLSIGYAIGLVLVARFLFIKQTKNDEQDDDNSFISRAIKDLIQVIGSSLFTLLLGYIVKHFI